MIITDYVTVIDSTGTERRMQADSGDSYQVKLSTGVGSGDLTADLSSATAATINELRLAFQTQRLLERDARSGTRYNETILAHFGVTVPDFRVQRPEFLGGGSTPINVNQVQQTDTTVGGLGAYAIGTGTHGFTKSFVEHGITLVCL